MWAVDPGDMGTDLYTAAVPEDTEPRPDPEASHPPSCGSWAAAGERPVHGGGPAGHGPEAGAMTALETLRVPPELSARVPAERRGAGA